MLLKPAEYVSLIFAEDNGGGWPALTLTGWWELHREAFWICVHTPDIMEEKG